MNASIIIFKRWLPLAFVATMLCGLVYGAVQQSYRQSANDPQIQMAEDAAAAISGNATGTINIEQSLSPYLVFYSDAGVPSGGNGFLHGLAPLLPPGIFDYVRAAGETRVTWQPEPGVRQAIVVVRIPGPQPGFVMAGRSLREVEIREWRLELMVFAAWGVTLAGLLLIEMLLVVWKPEHK